MPTDPTRPTWTREAPTEEGAYWLRRPGLEDEVVAVAYREGLLAFHFWASELLVTDPPIGFWTRIEPPAPPTEEETR